MKMKIVDGTEDVDGGGRVRTGSCNGFRSRRNVAALDTAVDSDSPVPGGTPTPAIGYSLRGYQRRSGCRRWRLGGAVGGDGADGRENSGVVVLLAGVGGDASC
ncbi:hypothetical protein E3N88_25163 [Mikania micrantha]|uniref:Uncharacterized protein n=1 Tax=Mikania micrantha TaxID=192012 RepID=A0A5N6N3Z7_9ASTR|nr:hypothetical protein E3N88_25163 [Mikania micrantha]